MDLCCLSSSYLESSQSVLPSFAPTFCWMLKTIGGKFDSWSVILCLACCCCALDLDELQKFRPVRQKPKVVAFIIMIVWLVHCWMLPFLRACSRLDDSVLDDRRLQDQCWVVLDQIQRCRTRWDAISPIGVPVPWQRGHTIHTCPKDSTVVHRWIGMCSVTEEFKADDVCDWWLISTLAGLVIRNAGPPGNA